MGCPTTGCTGYELAANLDLDTGRQRHGGRGGRVLARGRGLGADWP